MVAEQKVATLQGDTLDRRSISVLVGGQRNLVVMPAMAGESELLVSVSTIKHGNPPFDGETIDSIREGTDS